MELFEWDDDKAATNETKRGITFDEAETVFTDGNAATIDDIDHSDDELRFLIIGHSNDNRMLTVSYTYRGEKIRLISALRAVRSERQIYEEG
ncbi:MAG: BrnT family toxin [Armatimonadetes bacterium]|nr:BrnT family toxin [Armatimonadota bacterium]